MSNLSGHSQAHVDILIGHAVPLYREVLAATLSSLRPHLVVQRATPGELDSLACRLRPALVICSSASHIPARCAAFWAVLYPDDRDELILNTAQSSRTIPHATISMLLDLLDRELGL